MDENNVMGTVEELVEQLPDMKPTLFVKRSAADFLAELNGVFLLRDPKHWQWRTQSHERDIIRPDGTRLATRVSTLVYYFGWKGGNYHKLIDPVSMYGHRLDDIWPGEGGTIVRLRDWAVCLRDFCAENNLEIRPTIGGISAQFLTDPRFYPNPRRKIPAAINEVSRERMPGNFYLLNVQPTNKHEFRAYYLDQHRAHHYHAHNTPLPNANSLYAYGCFTTLDRVIWDHTWDDWYGLYCLDLEAPPLGDRRRWSRYKWTKGGKRVFVYSNELQFLQDLGFRVSGVRAAWGSRHRDRGLSEYSQWACTQLDRYGDPRWLKQLLLATYGILATTPRNRHAIFRLAKEGEPVKVLTGRRELNGLYCRSQKKLEPRIAAVLHRGMVESATRAESLGLADWLTHQGHRVLSIYADAVIVEDQEKLLPELPEPWRLKRTLNHLQFINQQAFISGEMTKLPGVSRELLAYRQHSFGRAPREKVKYMAGTGEKVRVKIGE